MISGLVFIFFAGSALGWLMELTYRKIRKGGISNPAVMDMPILPVYGAGAVCIYTISGTDLPLAVKIILIGLSTTVMELGIGYAFTSYYKLRLWDYSKNMLNVGGHICPAYSILWTLLGTSYALYLMGPISAAIQMMETMPWTSYAVGIVFGFFILDMLFTAARMSMIRRFILRFIADTGQEIDLDFTELRDEIERDLHRSRRLNRLTVFFLSFNMSSHWDLSRTLRRLLVRRDRARKRTKHVE